MMKRFLMIIFSFCCLVLNAQGKLEINNDPISKTAIQSYTSKVESEKVQGFKVQLCSESGNNARQKASHVRTSFLTRYPDQDVQMVWESPNFKVRAGNFTSKLDATLFWRQIVVFFPQAYVVTSEIKP